MYCGQNQVELIFVEGFSVTATVMWEKGGDVMGVDKGRDGQDGMWNSSPPPHPPSTITLQAMKLGEAL